MTAGRRLATAAVLGAVALVLAATAAAASARPGATAAVAAVAAPPTAASIELGVSVAPRPGTTESTSASPQPSGSPSQSGSPGSQRGPLPRTGMAISVVVLSGLALIGGGVGLRLLARRRNSGT